MLANAPNCAKCGRFMSWSKYVPKMVFGPDYWNGPDEVNIGICARCERLENSQKEPQHDPA